ncbi:MAG: hypothetical protein ACK5CA_08125 [Cyanobacteriota bacterium]|jgi:hypothetical protein
MSFQFLLSNANLKRRFETYLFCFYLALGLGGILNHAMWRDELNGWLIVRDSADWGALWRSLRYEGHPILWYLCLWLLEKGTNNPLAMQIFHWGLGAAATGLFIFKAPFSRWEKALFALGYLPLYEYFLISRNYALGYLALMGFCVVFPRRRYGVLALLLGIMANSNAYALLISLALAGVLGVEAYQNRLRGVKPWAFWGAVALYSGAVALAVWMLLPPGDSVLQGGASQWFWQLDLYRFNQSLSRVWNSYVLVLVPSDAQAWAVAIFSALSALILAFWALYFADYPLVLLFYLLASGLILLFTYLKFLGSARHYGHLYLILISALWLRRDDHPRFSLTQKIPRLAALKTWAEKTAPRFLILILVLQLVSGWIAFGRDLTLPYSASRETARYLQRQALSHLDLIGSEDFAVSPISAYLNRQIYYPESRRWGSYVLFNQSRQPVSDAEILAQIEAGLGTQFTAPVILVLNHPLQEDRDSLQIEPLQEITRSFIGNEQYYLYRIAPARSGIRN